MSIVSVLSTVGLRTAIKVTLAAALAGSWAMGSGHREFVWYPLIAVVMCMDETDTRIAAAARARVFGTVSAGVISFLVHTLLDGWIGLLVTFLILVPLLRIFQWQASLATAVVVSSMLFLVARYAELDWIYAFERTLDTLMGVAAVLVVNILFWPIDRLGEIRGLDQQLRRLMAQRLEAIQQQLKDPSQSPVEPPLAIVGSRLCQQLSQLVNDELRSNPNGDGRRLHWRQRSLLWDRINHHSLELQRIGMMLPKGALASEPTPWLECLPSLLQHSGGVVAPLPQRDNLMLVAEARSLPPLLMLALDDELQRLAHSAQSLARACRRRPPQQ